MNVSIRPSLVVPALSDRAKSLVAAMLSATEAEGLGWRIPAERAPSAEQRKWLSERLNLISDALHPAPEMEVRAELTALFVCMGHPTGDEIDAKAIIAIYVADLADVPGSALKQACADFRRGRVGNGRWVPTQAQLRTRADELLRAPRKELADIGRVLAARVMPPVDHGGREAVLAHVRETIRILKAASSGS